MAARQALPAGLVAESIGAQHAVQVGAGQQEGDQQVGGIQPKGHQQPGLAQQLRTFTEVRPRRPDRFVDVPFESTVTEPVGTAARVMTELGLTAGPDDLEAIEAYCDVNQQERHGSHNYTAEDFGLSDEQLDRDFAFYTEAYL